MHCLADGPPRQGGRARHKGPPASGSRRCGCNADYGFRSAPNDQVKSKPLAAVSAINNVPSTPRGPSEWSFPTNFLHLLDRGRTRPFPPSKEGAIRAFGIGVATQRRTRYDTRESQ